MADLHEFERWVAGVREQAQRELQRVTTSDRRRAGEETRLRQRIADCFGVGRLASEFKRQRADTEILP